MMRSDFIMSELRGKYLDHKLQRSYSFLLFLSILALSYSVFLVLGLDYTILLDKIKFTLLTKSLYFLFSRLGWFGLLVTGLLVLEDNYGGWCNMMSPSGESNSVGGESNMGGSSRGSGWTAFDEWVLTELNEEEVVQPNPQNAPANPVASQGAAQEALPQAPAPAEVAHPAPNEEEVSALLMGIHALIEERVREESERGVGPLSTQFPEQRVINSTTAHHIMVELELSTERNVDNLREWAERLREDRNLLKPIIKDYIPKR